MLDLRGAVLGKQPTPADEIWLRDGDVVIVPAMPIRLMDNFIRMVFTEGIYGIIPFQGVAINAGGNN
jgi:polysaccharide export outer membrane protein